MLQKYCGKWALLAVGCALWHLKHISCFLQKHNGSVSHWFQRRYIHSIPHCSKQMRSSYSKLKHAKRHIAHILTQPKARTVFFWILNCQECRKTACVQFECTKNLSLLMQNRNKIKRRDSVKPISCPRIFGDEWDPLLHLLWYSWNVWRIKLFATLTPYRIALH